MCAFASGQTVSATLFAAVLLRLSVLALAADCPAFPADSFQAAAAHEAVKCVGLAGAHAPPTSVGNMLLSDLSTVSVRNATCQTKGTRELTMRLKAGAGSMTLGAATCALHAMVLHKSASTADAKVGLRLDYTNCSSGPSTASVSLSVSRVADALAPETLVPFVRGSCGVVTTTPAQTQSKIELRFDEIQVGQNPCQGTVLETMSVADKQACRSLCVNRITPFADGQTVPDLPQMCRGYAFNGKTGTDNCKLYKGLVNTITTATSAAALPGWLCWNVTAKASKIAVSTPAPPSAAELAETEAKLPKLQVPITPTSASVLTYESPDKCFTPFNWITLQDSTQNAVSVKIRESEWAELLDMIPFDAGRRLAASPKATILADRAVYGAGQPAPAPAPVPVAPAPPAPPVVETKTVETYSDCVAGEVGNAIVTAIVVPLLTWLGVAVLFHFLAAKKTGGKSYSQLEAADGDAPVGCSTQTTLILICGALLVASVAAFVVVLLMSFAFSGFCAASSFDMTLIRLSSAVTTIAAVGMGLFYLSTKHHATHVASNVSGDSGSKFMLVKVQGNKNIPVNKSDIVDASGNSIFLSQAA